MEKNESILSDRAKKAAEKVKEFFTRRAVGAQILETDYYLWENYRQRCKKYKVPITPEGMKHLLMLSEKIDPVFWRIAKASGLEPIPFTEGRIDKLLDAVKNDKDWMNHTDQLHDDIISETDKNLTIQVKKK